MEIYLIRHTTPDIENGVCYGQSDINVDKQIFNQELALIQSKLPDDIEQYYSSPLFRCQHLSQHLSTSFQTDARLMELNFGDWELQKWSEINDEDLDHWMADFVNNTPSGGENYISLFQRTQEFLTDLLSNSNKKTAIVTHAGNIRSFICYCLDLSLENSFRIDIKYGAVIHLVIENEKCFCKLISIK